MSNVTKLPTAATSYYTVHKAGKGWNVVLVTPSTARPIKTALYRFTTKDAAEDHGRAVAAKMLRPFKGRLS